jgi:hypothetical protein
LVGIFWWNLKRDLKNIFEVLVQILFGKEMGEERRSGSEWDLLQYFMLQLLLPGVLS